MTNNILNKVVKTTLISTLASTFLLGADVPNIGDVEKQIKTPNIKKEQTPLVDLGGVKEYKAPMIDSGKTLLINDFKITGNDHIKTAVLEQFFIDSKGKNLTFNELQTIASAITKYYRENGYFVARAYIPAQNVLKNNNVLEIAVIEGNYGEFKLDNKSLVKNFIVQGMLDNAKQRDNVISTNTLERAMLIINDTPGVVVSAADVMPGTNVGTSDFAISTQASKKYDGYLVTDNTGSRYTGKYRAMVGLNINSPFNIGDKIALSGLVSNGHNLKNGRIGYSLPLASNGLRGEIAYSKTDYSLTDSYKELDAVGNSNTVEAILTYPYIRTRTENLNTTLSLAKKVSEDIVNSTNTTTKKDTKSLTLGLDYTKNYLAFTKNTNSSVNINLTYGNLKDQSTDIINGNYSKVNIDLNHNIALTNTISLESSLKTQYALGNKNLTGGEDFSIGGESGVKLYPSGELSAENGYIFTIEAKYQLPVYKNISNTIGVFYDRGRAWMTNSEDDTTFKAKSLQDMGIGLYSSYDKYFSKVQIAWNTNSDKVTSEPNRNSRILFQGGMSF